MAKIVEYIATGHTDLVLYKTPALLILLGLAGSVVFHEISALTAHHLAFRLSEDTRKELARTFSRLSMGEIEKKQRRISPAEASGKQFVKGISSPSNTMDNLWTILYSAD